jgi:hypothetical protein
MVLCLVSSVFASLSLLESILKCPGWKNPCVCVNAVMKILPSNVHLTEFLEGRLYAVPRTTKMARHHHTVSIVSWKYVFSCE